MHPRETPCSPALRRRASAPVSLLPAAGGIAQTAMDLPSPGWRLAHQASRAFPWHVAHVLHRGAKEKTAAETGNAPGSQTSDSRSSILSGISLEGRETPPEWAAALHSNIQQGLGPQSKFAPFSSLRGSRRRGLR